LSEVTVLQTVRDAVATKLDEIEGLTIYKNQPPSGGAVPCATMLVLGGNMHGGYPDTLQFVDLLLQVDVWAFTPENRDIYADKIIDKVYRSRPAGFVDIVLRGCRDMPGEEEVWRKVLEFRVTTTVTKT